MPMLKPRGTRAIAAAKKTAKTRSIRAAKTSPRKAGAKRSIGRRKAA